MWEKNVLGTGRADNDEYVMVLQGLLHSHLCSNVSSSERPSQTTLQETAPS